MSVSNVTTTSARVRNPINPKYDTTITLSTDCTSLASSLITVQSQRKVFIEDCENAKRQIMARADAERLKIQNQTLTSLGQPAATNTTQAEALIQNIGIKANVDESLLRAENQKADLVSTQADIEGKESKKKLTIFLIIGGVIVVGAIITYIIIKKGKL
jgi:hypothetical protein